LEKRNSGVSNRRAAFGSWSVLVGYGHRAQRLAHEDLLRLQVVAAQSLIRPDRKRYRGNHEEGEERKR